MQTIPNFYLPLKNFLPAELCLLSIVPVSFSASVIEAKMSFKIPENFSAAEYGNWMNFILPFCGLRKFGTKIWKILLRLKSLPTFFN